MLERYLAYNTWANQQLCGYILNAEDKADTELISSFPSIRKTLYHIWDAQVIWLERINNIPFSGWPASKNFNGDLREATEQFHTSSLELEKVIQSMPPDTLINYKNIKGHPFTSTLEEIVMHACNHGTYHRGQLVTLLRQCGYTEIGSTDLITFFRI